MKNIFTFLFLILCLVNDLSGQKQEVYYYNSERLKADKSDASYYKVLNYTKDGKIDGKIKDYYKSGEGLSMIDGAKVINKDDDNKSVYWGKKIEYYKNQLMKSKTLYDLEGNPIYKKNWYENGNIESYISLIPGTTSTLWINYNSDGSVSECKRTNRDGDWDPRIFNKKDGFYYTTFTEDFSTDLNIKMWEEKLPLKEGKFDQTNGYKIITTENIQTKKIIPLFDNFNKNYYFDIDIQLDSGDKNTMHGLIYNYVDEHKYSGFGVNAIGNFCIFHVDNSEILFEVQNSKSESINENKRSNHLSANKKDGIISFELNGKIIYRSEMVNEDAIAFGLFSDGGKKEVLITNVTLFYLSDFMQKAQEQALDWDGANTTGTGFMIDERGYMVTNNHVIKDAKYIEVEFMWEGKIKMFPAKVVANDPENDLAIIRIISNDFKTNGPLPFSILRDNILVGSNVFTLGYPLALDVMGKEVKFTDGKISALSGIRNNKLVYQTTIPIRDGNSGGAVFDDNGNIVGVLRSTLIGSEVVSYAIKSSILYKFIKNFNSDMVLTRSANLSKQPLTAKIKTLSNHVALVKVW